MGRVLLVPAPAISAGGRLHGCLPLGSLALRALAPSQVEVLLPPDELLEARVDGPEKLVSALLAGAELDRYDAVGLSTMCGSFHHSLRLAREVRARAPRVAVWAGGPQASATAQELLRAEPAVDAVFVGEAEPAFAAALERLARGERRLDGLSGVATRAGGLVVGEPPADLDRLPWPELDEGALGLLARSAARLGREPVLPLEAARGCPGRCTFCSTRRLFGRRVRRRSEDLLAARMAELAARTGIRRFELVGDNLAAPVDRLLALAAAVGRIAPAVLWYGDLKLDLLRPADLEPLMRGGCKGFFVGLESASPETLRRIRKGVRIDRALEVIRRAVGMGFEVKTSLIVGFPWEGPEEVDRTYRLHAELLELGVVESQLWLLCPIAGTELEASQPSGLELRGSLLGADGIALGPEDERLVRSHPALFPHLGRFETPLASALELDATVAAAGQLLALYLRAAAPPPVPDRV